MQDESRKKIVTPVKNFEMLQKAKDLVKKSIDNLKSPNIEAMFSCDNNHNPQLAFGSSNSTKNVSGLNFNNKW